MELPDASPDLQDAAAKAQADHLRRMHMRQLRLLWPEFRTYNQNTRYDSETDSEKTSHSSDDDGYATLAASPEDSVPKSSTPSIRDSVSSTSSRYPFSISSILGSSSESSTRSSSPSSSVSSMSSIYPSSRQSGSSTSLDSVNSSSSLASSEDSGVITSPSRKRRRGRPQGSYKYPRTVEQPQLPCEHPNMARTYRYDDNEDDRSREKREKNRFAGRACRVRSRQRAEEQLKQAKEQCEQVAYVRSARSRLKALSIKAGDLMQRLPANHPEIEACLDEFDQIAVENAEFFGKYPDQAPFYKLE